VITISKVVTFIVAVAQASKQQESKAATLAVCATAVATVFIPLLT
jgi:hypothetical protein